MEETQERCKSSLRNSNRVNNPDSHKEDCECRRSVAEMQMDLLNEVLPSSGVNRMNNWILAPVADA